MQPSESLYPADWLRIAERDLVRVEQALENDDPDLAGFCLQQAVEKFLKGFLLAHGWRLRRLHDLDVLLDDAIAYAPSLEQFRFICQRITKYYMVERYPVVGRGGPTEAEVRAALTEVQPLIVSLRNLPHST